MDVDEYLTPIVESAPKLLVALDYDGTLAPIVNDPDQAWPHPDAQRVLIDLARHRLELAIITGRPAGQVVELCGLDALADALGEAHLTVLGQYGNERWSSDHRVVDSAPRPDGLADFRAELPALLDEAQEQPWVEDKGLAVALHTRRLPDPAHSYQELLPVISDAADAHGLVTEPGRQVIEVRGPGMDKGEALAALVDEVGAHAVIFAGDDLGDLEAFHQLDVLRAAGMTTLKVCSGSQEESALTTSADVVVAGPSGVLALLEILATRLTGSAVSE